VKIYFWIGIKSRVCLAGKLLLAFNCLFVGIVLYSPMGFIECVSMAYVCFSVVSSLNLYTIY